MMHFEGDGRERMDPTDVFPGTQPQPIRRSAANRLVEMFRDCGYSHHTRSGSTMWVILRFCREANVPYTLKVASSGGYEIRRLPSTANTLPSTANTNHETQPSDT